MFGGSQVREAVWIQPMRLRCFNCGCAPKPFSFGKMDEIVDVVDESDNVIGQELKSKCHANQFLHRSSGILLFKDSSFQEILIQKRSVKKKTRPGKLAIPGGHVASGESYLDAAKKELQEEEFYGQKLPEEIIFDELYKIKKSTDNDHEFTTVFRVVHPGPFSHNPEEVESSSFIEINKLLEDINKNPEEYTKTAVLHIKEYLKNKK